MPLRARGNRQFVISFLLLFGSLTETMISTALELNKMLFVGACQSFE